MRMTSRPGFRALALVLVLSTLLIAAGCGGSSTAAPRPTPTPVPSPSPSPSPAPKPSPTPTPAPSPSPTPTPAPSPTPTPSPSPTPTPSPSPTPTPAPSAQGPVIVVLEENHGYSSVIGNTAMPYLNGLANQYSLATQYYADTHPSIGNYFMMTAGQIITNDDAYMSTVTVDNLVRHLITAGKTWKSYAEGLPSVGYTGGDTGLYVRHHNPFSYFSDVVNSGVQKMNLVPFPQFAADLNAGQLPDFSFVVPNLDDDAHNGTLAQADSWLQTNISPLINSAAFQKNGLLLIVFDEADTSDSTNGGGHVAMVAVGPLVKHAAQSAVLYQHESLLKTVTNYLGIDGNLGKAATAPAMSDLVQ
jgi:hypothetical protein